MKPFAELALGLLVPLALSARLTAQPAIEGYANYETLLEQLKALDKSDLVALDSLGKTLGGREVHVLTLARGEAGSKPAMLIVGNVHAPYLLGSELALRVAQRLAAGEAALLDRFTFYVIPRPNPDASEAFFRPPYFERAANERPADDDRDGETDEDPYEDLNGDGQITMLRVEDEAGEYMPHPAEPRVLIKADPRKNEHGRYALYSEGRDNDADELFNEDGPGGTSFNRNFTFRYPFFQPRAGPHQVSEVETRGVADFAFAHPNIALVFCFSPEDNLFEPWKPNPGAEGERIKTTLQAADAEYVNYLAEQYRGIHGGKDAPDAAKGEGSFSEWAYFHYGRWSLAARGWWVPKTAAADAAAPVNKPDGDKPAEAEKKPEGKPKGADEKRGADDFQALNWFKSQAIGGFVDWKAIEHPDFPGRKVEVGGFKPYLRLNPPASELDGLAEKHFQFLSKLGELMPKLRLTETKVEPLGEGGFRLSVKVVNDGYLASMPAMGVKSGEPHPLQIKIELPAEVKLLTGHLRAKLPPLGGNGGQAEHSWVLLAPAGKSPSVKLTVWSPSVGSDSKTVELAPAKEAAP